MTNINRDRMIAVLPALFVAGLFGPATALAATLLSQATLGAANYTANANQTSTFTQTVNCAGVNGTVTSIDVFVGSAGATLNAVVSFDGIVFGPIAGANTGNRVYTVTGGPVACTSGVKTLQIRDNSTNGIYVFGSIANTYPGGSSSCANCSLSNGGIQDSYFVLYGSTGSTPAGSPATALPASKEGVLLSSGTINVVALVINDNGGTKTVADFPLFVKGMKVISGATNNFIAPAAQYAVTEIFDPKYAHVFSGDCDIEGHIALNPGDNRFCIITNNDIGLPVTKALTPPLISAVRIATPQLLSGPDSVTYTTTIVNIGTIPVETITVVGESCSPIVYISGDANGDGRLDVNEMWTYHCSTHLMKTTTSNVVATGWANGISTVSIANTTVSVGTEFVPPVIHVTKIPSPLALPVGGGMVTYVKTVTNPGATPLSNISLTDDKCDNLNFLYGDTNGDNLLDHNESWVYSCSMNLSETTTNTVTASGDAHGMTARGFAVVTVVVASPLLPNTGILSVGTMSASSVRTIPIGLSVGSSGNDVMVLQQFLIAENKGPAAAALLSVGATGYFGGLTRTALAEFQASVGISPAYGYFGSITRAYLIAHY